MALRLFLIQLTYFQIHISVFIVSVSNWVTESGVHPSVHVNIHHQVVFTKLNLKVEYHSLHKRLTWDYRNRDFWSANRLIDILSGVIYSKVKMLIN